MPRERTTFLLQCLKDAEVAEAAKAADAPKAADAAKATEATMAQVAPPTLAPPTPTPTPSRPSEKIDRDWASWNWQQQQALSPMPYWTLNSTWNQNGLVNGRDFTQTITMYPHSCPSGTVIEWSWPNTPALYNV